MRHEIYRDFFFHFSLKDFWCYNELWWKPIWFQPCLACRVIITAVPSKSSDDEKAPSTLWLWPWIICDGAEAALFRWPDANSWPACVSMPLLGHGEWQVTLNCVVLLRWHANDKDWERPLTVYSPNQSKLCDEKAKRLIRTPGSGCMWQGLQKSSRLVIQTLRSRMGINSNCSLVSSWVSALNSCCLSVV